MFQTTRDLLRYAVTRFNKAGLTFGHGNAYAYDEAAYLILHTLSLPLDLLEPFLDARLLDDEIETVMQVIERRAEKRIPAAYITREAWMNGLKFYVDERVIVPRSLIGELLQEGLAPWVSSPDEVGSVLDLCTGSGCLAIMGALAFPQAEVDAVDLSADALEVAKRNRADFGLAGRLSLHRGDLYAALPAGKRYDLIISNPPYVNQASMDALPAEYRAEPGMALAGGEDGMDLVRDILAGARERLTPDGLLVVEIGNEFANFNAAFPGLNVTWLDTSAGDEQVFLVYAADLP
ncbi:MAG: 50S ribosomal protein L3 N(5)-glutamine methyltransferase [Candidatus Protistobacter heckmanni]|nr:50S ribosomal protein L3 N(5)-glutamine methyltransferase [Candidatus Protistobacter heckmanni]